MSRATPATQYEVAREELAADLGDAAAEQFIGRIREQTMLLPKRHRIFVVARRPQQ